MQRGFLIDMDGVVYRGGELIAGAAEFIAELQASETPFTFLTNNSQRKADHRLAQRGAGNSSGRHDYSAVACGAARWAVSGAGAPKNRSITSVASRAGRNVSAWMQHQLDFTSASTSSPRLMTVS